MVNVVQQQTCRKLKPDHLGRALSSARTTATTVHKFNLSEDDAEVIKATLPLVANAGTTFTKHFYQRVFTKHPELLNLFNQTNQSRGKQPTRLLVSIALAAQSAIETGELPGEAIESICQKHCALDVTPEAYNVVGENVLGTIQDLFTKEPAVITAWGNLYNDVVKAFVSRETELKSEMANTVGGWLGRRKFRLEAKDPMSSTITRFRFVPADGGATPEFKPGMYTTIWCPVENVSSPYGSYKEQPRHYTLAVPRDPANSGRTLSISVKKDGLVSSILHEAEVNSEWELSAPYGCFDLSGVEKLWLSDIDAPVIFLSAGVGITPVLAMLENIYVTRPATWLHSSTSGKVHAYRDRLRNIASVRHGHLQRRVWYSQPVEEDGEPAGDSNNAAKFHFHGRMNLEEFASSASSASEVLHLDNQNAQYFMCGPSSFMESQQEALVSLGVSSDRIHFESF